jgi:EpsI family protein
MIPLTTWPRFSATIACLLSTSLLLHFRSASEIVVPHTDLSHLSMQINGWSGTRIELTREDVASLGSGQFLLHDYARAGGPAVTLFVAYYPSQRTGDTMHSPKNCMPGSGWTPTKSSIITIQADDGRLITANRYILTQDKESLVVLYWYQAHGHTEANEYVAKWLLVRDAITMNRTDGALVRVLTSVENGETEAHAENRAIRFTQEAAPQLDAYLPR